MAAANGCNTGIAGEVLEHPMGTRPQHNGLLLSFEALKLLRRTDESR
jgi:hypothetical protein